MKQITGRISKATGGFYYIQQDETLYECRARGVFRKQGITPLVGDIVDAEVTGETGGYILSLHPRKNALVRPPLANIDTFALISSVGDPAPNLLVIDKMIAIAVYNAIRPLLIITKSDLGDAAPLEEIYRSVGMEVFVLSNQSDDGLAALRQALSYGITAFSGNTGVGKSSLLNRIDERLSLATGETSRKLGRGRHTTRHVELFAIGPDGFIADTPGFSAVDLERYEPIRKEELAACFEEFAPFTGDCRFTGCSHTVEKGCAVLAALGEGKIAPSRHTNYCMMYEEAKKRKDWENKG